MISPKYYNEENLKQVYLNGKLRHYMHKDKATVVKKRPYTLLYGEDIYTLAERIFGSDSLYHWTIIADINKLRRPDDWKEGEVVWIPEIIVNEEHKVQKRYSEARSSTTAI
jgi:hypothetical protein